MSTILKIKKRDGAIADFNPEKISAAIAKAYTEVRGAADTEKIILITQSVVEQLEQTFQESTPAVEAVQRARLGRGSP